MKIRQDFLPKGHRNRPGYKMEPKGLLIHTTNNWSDGAGDEMHGEYMENTGRVVSWHYTVDKDSCTQHIPDNENAWHAGDGGNGFYNRNYLGLEIACEAVEPGQPLDLATYRNAVEVAAQIMIKHGFNEDQIQPHRVVYGKNCPHHTLILFDDFKRDVLAEIEKQKVPQWKLNEVQWAVDFGLLQKEWLDKVDETFPVWAICNMFRDYHEKTKGEK